jgi:hypothetical protein
MGDLLYKRIQKRLLQTTRFKTMPRLPTFPNRSEAKGLVVRSIESTRCPLVPATKLGSLDSSWTPNLGSWRSWRL